MSASKYNISHNEKHYRKLMRTIKFVVYMVLSALAVLIVGLVLVWVFDKAPDNPFGHGWNLFFVIVFALLAAGLQIPNYIMDIRKINMGDSTPTKDVAPKSYEPALNHARKEGLIDEDNQLLVSRAEFVRFCRDNKYFSPHGRESWKLIEGILKGPGGKPITAEQLAQTNQDIQLREGV